MVKSLKLIVGSVAIALVGLSVYSVIQPDKFRYANEHVATVSTDFEFVKESEYPIASSSASMYYYDSLEEMRDASVLIGEIYIKDQYVEYIGDSQMPATWSEAEVKQVYKGDKNIKNIKIGEVGGLVDREKIKPIKKKFDDIPVKQERFYEKTIEGNPVMKKGNTYIVMLGKGVFENTYEIVGAQGKIRISDQSGKGVVTVVPEVFAENMNKIYWFQRKFAGKGKAEIAATLMNL